MTASSNARPKHIEPADDSGGARGSRAPRRDFALIIGIDHYRHLEKLEGAVDDAQRFLDWVTREDGGNVPRDNVRFAPSQPGQVCPVKDQIDVALEELIQAARAENGGGRRLYFHFSGHGGGGELIDDVALLLAEWSRSAGGRALSADKYRRRLIGLHAFEEIVVLLDCCRRAAKSVFGLAPRFRIKPGPGCATRHFIAYATEAGGFANEERGPDGKWQGELTGCLLSILRAHGGISATELKDTLTGRLQEKGRRAEVVNGLLEGSTFGPRGALPLPILLLEFRNAVGKVTISARDACGKRVIGTWPVTPTPLRLPLPNGLYRIEDSTGGYRIIEHAAQVETTPDGEQLMTHETF